MDSCKKSAVKLGLFYGTVMGLFAGLLGLCLFPGLGCLVFNQNVILGLILGVLLDMVAAVLFGTACGLIYGLIMANFLKKKAQEFAPVREAFRAQGCLFFDDVANHMMGKEGVGGWMFILTDSLYFKSHQQNVQVHEQRIPLVSIRRVTCTKSGMRGMFSSGLDIELADGRVEKYVVNDRKIWMDKIAEACRRVGNDIHKK
ncbi:MAG: hypothetical protein II994_09525 [Lachnospiraceae bacterium]|nr:hypothetical protein [Lachnospiraceae bacterium]